MLQLTLRWREEESGRSVSVHLKLLVNNPVQKTNQKKVKAQKGSHRDLAPSLRVWGQFRFGASS